MAIVGTWDQTVGNGSAVLAGHVLPHVTAPLRKMPFLVVQTGVLKAVSLQEGEEGTCARHEPCLGQAAIDLRHQKLLG